MLWSIWKAFFKRTVYVCIINLIGHLWFHVLRLYGKMVVSVERNAEFMWRSSCRNYLHKISSGLFNCQPRGKGKKQSVCVCVGLKPHTPTISLTYGSLMWVLMEVLAAETANRPWICLTKNWVCVRVRACMYLYVCESMHALKAELFSCYFVE